MKAAQISIVAFDRDPRLLESSKWTLEGRGYRVIPITHLAELESIPLTPPITLLVLCHSLSPKEGADAIAQASKRWPGIEKLTLLRNRSANPSELLGQILHTLDRPARQVSVASELAGYAGSSSYSHIY
jgi:DNA-binding response OmpR family regulator